MTDSNNCVSICNMSSLSEELVKLQTVNNITDVGMARKLGISKMHWWRISTGRSQLTGKLLARAIDLKNELLKSAIKNFTDIFLTSSVSSSNSKE